MAPRNYQHDNGGSLHANDSSIDGDEEGQSLLMGGHSHNSRVAEYRRRRRSSLILWLALVVAVGIGILGWMISSHGWIRRHKKENKASITTTSTDDDDGGLADDAVSSSSTKKAEKKAQETADKRLAKLNDQSMSSSNDVTTSCEATVLLMRHCEKTGDDTQDAQGNEHCTYLGYQRADFLATLFDNHNGTSRRWPRPQHLYAYSIHRKHHLNFREWETLKPLSDAIGVDVVLADHPDLADTLLWDWLAQGKACGQVTVVSWRHSRLPVLAHLLGCGPDNGCPVEYPDDTFDLVWQLQFVYNAGGGGYAQQDAYRAEELALASDDQYTDKEEKKEKKKQWRVYGMVDKLGFDPLAFGREEEKYP